jgi:methionine-rich copper-binding protein CopC
MEHAMRRHFLRAGLALLIARLIALGGFAFVTPARAHAYLRRAVPAVGSTVPSAPAEVVCDFTEELEPSFSKLEVQDASGKRVDTGDMHLAPNDARQMIIGLSKVGPGTYTVIWHAVSVDTHRTEGRFTFNVA